MPQIDLASWSSPSRAFWPSGAQERGLSITTTAGRFAMTMSTTCLHVTWLWSARTRRSSMTATSKPFAFRLHQRQPTQPRIKACPTPVPLALWLSRQALTNARLPSPRLPLCDRTQWPARYPDPTGAMALQDADGAAAKRPIGGRCESVVPDRRAVAVTCGENKNRQHGRRGGARASVRRIR